MYYTYTCITIDSVMEMERKNYPHVATCLFRRMQIQNEKDKDDQIHTS